MKFKETKITAILAVVFVLVVVSMSAYAADLTVPHTFSPGTAAKSSEVNENFTTIYNEVNALKKQLSNDWIKLLDNASYSGCYEEHKYTPLATGQFSQVKAVYKSGYITCNTSNYPETSSNPYKWQLCNPEGGAVAFELKKNDAYLLSQSDYQHIYLRPHRFVKYTDYSRLRGVFFELASIHRYLKG